MLKMCEDANYHVKNNRVSHSAEKADIYTHTHNISTIDLLIGVGRIALSRKVA